MLEDFLLSPLTIFLVVVLSIITYLLYTHTLYPSLISPLAKLPSAHPTSPFSSTWIQKQRNKLNESHAIFQAHKIHGSIVRLAPNEVSIASLSGLKALYGNSVVSGGLARSTWFNDFANYDGTPNLVTSYDNGEHAKRKRALGGVYKKSVLLNSEDFAGLSRVILFARLLPILQIAALEMEEGEEKEGIDVFELGCALGAEFISAYEFGTAGGMDIVKMGKKEERKEYLEFGKRKLRGLVGKEEARRELERQCLEMCKRAERQMTDMEHGKERADIKDEKSRERKSSETYPVVYSQLRSSIVSQDVLAVPQEQIRHLIASELLDNIEAGREGIGIALTYTMHELCLYPSIQLVLRKELHSIKSAFMFPTSQFQALKPSDLRDLDRLPLLEAIVMETLRLRVPAPGPQRRVVPNGGVTLEGYFIPAGVIIHSSPFTLHRDETAFPEPEVWRPERWLGVKNEADRRWFWAFGSGSKMCLGNQFTTLVLKVVLAAIYVNFETFVIDDEGIEQIDDMMATPKGDKLILGFKCAGLGSGVS